MLIFALGLLTGALNGPSPRMPWISPMDYPAALQSQKAGGTVEAELQFDAGGRVTACTIVASSGSALLDARTCWLSQRRARARAGDPRVQRLRHQWAAPR